MQSPQSSFTWSVIITCMYFSFVPLIPRKIASFIDEKSFSPLLSMLKDGQKMSLMYTTLKVDVRVRHRANPPVMGCKIDFACDLTIHGKVFLIKKFCPLVKTSCSPAKKMLMKPLLSN